MEGNAPSVGPMRLDDQEFQVLREPSTGSEAWILPSVGANCVKFTTNVGGAPLDVIGLPHSWESFRGRPTLFGAAILFPFPGRVRGGRFRFQGKEYQVPINEPEAGNSLHGCVSRRPWTLVEACGTPEGGAAVTFRIGTDEQRELNEEYPFPFRLTLTARLKDGTLRHSFVAENLGNEPMPIGLGLHPYIPLPLGRAGSVEDCELWVDAPYYWEQEGHMPIGTTRPSSEAIDLRQPRSLRALASVGIGGPDRMVNFVHGQFSQDRAPEPGERGVSSGVRNPVTRREVIVEADAAFPVAVTYVPPSRDKVSFEPHTCLPNAFNLEAEGRVAGAITLGPREFWRGTTTIRAREY